MKTKPTVHKNAVHKSYLVRLWRNGPAEPWRASLHNALTGERHYFAEPVQLFYFLQSQMADDDNQKYELDLSV